MAQVNSSPDLPPVPVRTQLSLPPGIVRQMMIPSRVFAGTHRNCWIYLPPGYDGKTPAPVAIFQDGAALLDPNGLWGASTLLTERIRARQIPPLVGIFVDPGVVSMADPNAPPRDNRPFEYESNSDQYARLLIDEVLPFVGKLYALSDKPADRAICGVGSGGLAALTAAWHRPDAFGRVICFAGDLSALRGGERYADAFREYEAKPLRIAARHFAAPAAGLPDAVGALQMDELSASLEFASIPQQVVPGTLPRDAGVCRAALADALKWVWQDPSPTTQPARVTPPPLATILLPGEPWRAVAGGFGFTEAPVSDVSGNVYFADARNSRIHKFDIDGKLSLFASDTGQANGLAFGPDGRLYACELGRDRVVAFNMKDARETVIADGIEQCNDLAISPAGGIYVTEPRKKQIWYITPDAGHAKRVVSSGIGFPNGIRFTPDMSQVAVADTHGISCYLFKVLPDMALGIRSPFYTLATPGDQPGSDADGITFDNAGRLYVASHVGLQVFDRDGHRLGIIDKPQRQWFASITFAGRNHDTLFAACGDKLFARKTQVRGVKSIGTTRPTLP